MSLKIEENSCLQVQIIRKTIQGKFSISKRRYYFENTFDIFVTFGHFDMKSSELLND